MNSAVVVFDGYTRAGPKDHEDQRRTKTFSSNVAVDEHTTCTMSKTRFLSNSFNKSRLIELLRTVLMTSSDVSVVISDDDADTLIVSETLDLANIGPVKVRAEDTDVLCMLVYHIRNVTHDVSFITKTACYSVRAIEQALPEKEREVLLLSHAYSGCDTTSCVKGFGKVSFLKKLSSPSFPQHTLQVLLDPTSSREEAISSGVSLFQYIYGHPSTPLHEQRFIKYTKLMAKGKFLPSKLPPTEEAAVQHSLRAVLQTSDWTLLRNQSRAPSEYGWKLGAKGYEPIGKVAPDSVLNFTSCITAGRTLKNPPVGTVNVLARD